LFCRRFRFSGRWRDSSALQTERSQAVGEFFRSIKPTDQLGYSRCDVAKIAACLKTRPLQKNTAEVRCEIIRITRERNAVLVAGSVHVPSTSFHAVVDEHFVKLRIVRCHECGTSVWLIIALLFSRVRLQEVKDCI